MRETQVQSLSGEDPLEKAMAPHSSTLAWKIPWTEEPGRLQSIGSQSRDTTERLHFYSSMQPMGSQRVGHDLATERQHSSRTSSKLC